MQGSTVVFTFCKLPMLLTQSVIRLLFLVGFSTLATTPAVVFPPACMPDSIRVKNTKDQTYTVKYALREGIGWRYLPLPQSKQEKPGLHKLRGARTPRGLDTG